MIVPCAKVAQI